MNHDYAHCLDYDIETCPESCFRARLTKDYKERFLEFAGIPVSWAHLKNTAECNKTGGNPCSNCIRRDWCKMDSKAVTSCAQYEPTSETHTQHKPKTHADQIRAKTDEELAKFLSNIRNGCRALTTGSYVCEFYTDNLDTDCKACWLDWLKQEADGDIV